MQWKKGAEHHFWPAETPTCELSWSQLNLDQHIELVHMLIWSELMLMSTFCISGNTNVWLYFFDYFFRLKLTPDLDHLNLQKKFGRFLPYKYGYVSPSMYLILTIDLYGFDPTDPGSFGVFSILNWSKKVKTWASNNTVNNN